MRSVGSVTEIRVLEVGMSAPRRIVILGSSGTCLDILEIIEALDAAAGGGHLACVGFLDDRRELWGRTVEGIPVLGGLEEALSLDPGIWLVNGIGSPRNHRDKHKIIARAGVPDARFATLVHPRAHVSRSAVLGAGTVVLANAAVGARATLGRHVMVLQQSVVSHDAVVGDYVSLATGVCISGGVRVGAHAYIGGNAAVIDGGVIGEGALVGLGSVVRQPVEAGHVVAGNPARILR